MWLLPRLPSFHQANGDIQLNLACSYEDVSFTSGYYDLDIRHGYAHWTHGEVKTLRDEFIAPLASEDYLKRFPVSMPEDLLDRRLIFSEAPLVQWRQWFGKFGVAAAPKAYDFSFDRSYMSLEAAALGHGIAHRKHDARIGPPQTGFARTGIRSYVRYAIDAFGTERCMFASNFPVDKLFSSYDDVFNAFKAITRDFSIGERRALFHDNAERVYRL
jgi:DNA-binding transcriptional LysR family regulator